MLARSKTWLTLLVLWLLALATALPAAAQTLDALPKSLFRFGTVYATAVQSDGKVIVGGDFQIANTDERQYLARFNANGTLDTSWNPKPAGGPVRAIAVDASGNVYIGGTFGNVVPATGQGSSVIRRGVAKISGSTGAVDGWNPDALIGASTRGLVYALAISGSNIYVGGKFDTIGGATRPCFARVSLSTGVTDTSIGSAGSGQCASLGTNGEVRAIAVDSTGAYIAAGKFGVSKGSSSGVFAWFVDWPGSGTDASSIYAHALHVDASNNVYVGGNFTTINSTARTAVAKLVAATGAVDTWNATVSGSAETVTAIARDGSGNIFIGGAFTSAGGLSRTGLAKLSGSNAAGNASFTADLGPVQALAFAQSGALIAGGYIGGVGTTRQLGIVQVSATTGVYDAGFAGQVQNVPLVNAIVRQPTGHVIVGGRFDGLTDGTIAGTTSMQALIRFDAAGNPDQTWFNNAFPSNTGPSAPPGQNPADLQIDALAVDASGNVFVAGNFYDIGGGSHLGLVKLNAGNGFEASGWSINQDSYGDVTSLAVNGSHLYLGSNAPGGLVASTVLNGKRLGRVATSDGAADATWTPEANNAVYALLADGSGNLYVAGTFTSILGTTRNKLAKITSSGALDTYNPDLGSSSTAATTPFRLALDASANLYVRSGGSPMTVGGQNRNGIARLSSVGVLDSWNPDAAPVPSSGLGVAVDSGFVYAGVSRYAVSTGLKDYSWALTPAGGTDASAAAVAQLFLDGSRLWAGGVFHRLAGQAHAGIAALTPSGSSIAAPGAPTIGAATPGNQQATIAFTPPGSTGGSPIISYTVTCGVDTASGSASPITLTGLTNFVQYTCSVTASNSLATGPASATVLVTPALNSTVTSLISSVNPSIAGTPVTFTATVTGAAPTGTVTFRDGGPSSPISGCDPVVLSGGIAQCTTSSLSALEVPHDITARYNGDANNDVSISTTLGQTVILAPTAPGAPIIGTATGGNAQASVAFTPPVSNGGATITGYTATSSPGNLTGTGSASPIVVNGLTNGAAYTFTVTATNSVGTSAPSAASNSVTPQGASGNILQLRARLTGAQVPTASTQTGVATMTFDTGSKLLTWSVSYTGLTGSLSVAHFHGPAAAGTDAAPVVSMPNSASPLTGSATLDGTQEAQLLSGQWYINIHSTTFPNGEIRGQVRRVLRDFDGNGKADVFWKYEATGTTYVWKMNGTAIAGTGSPATVGGPGVGWSLQGLGDFNGDGRADMLWRNSLSGAVVVWLMDTNGTSILSTGSPATVADANWTVQAVGDFNGDGRADVLWTNSSTGAVLIWLMNANGTSILSSASPASLGASTPWSVQGVGDFNGDGRTDILWRHATSGTTLVWLMNGTTISSAASPATVPSDWTVRGVGDFDGNGKADILWQNSTSGTTLVWLMNGAAIATAGSPATVPSGWSVQGVADYNGDGTADIFWKNATSGTTLVWLMNGTLIGSSGSPATVGTDVNWQVQNPR